MSDSNITEAQQRLHQIKQELRAIADAPHATRDQAAIAGLTGEALRLLGAPEIAEAYAAARLLRVPETGARGASIPEPVPLFGEPERQRRLDEALGRVPYQVGDDPARLFGVSRGDDEC